MALPTGMAIKQWKPGQSGNPGGKVKAHLEVIKLCRENGVEAIEKLIDLMRTSRDERVVYMAAVHILDRGFGKPKEHVNNGEDKPNFTQEEKIEILQEIARRHGYNLEPAKDGA